MNSGLYPVDLSGVDWASTRQVYTETMCDWLFSSGSLTQRLKDYQRDFSVIVLSEKVVSLTAEQRNLLNASSIDTTVREVFLCVDGKPWVFAQSILPHCALHSGFASLVNIGDKPLGELLFTTTDVIRGKLLAAQFDLQSALHQFLLQQAVPVEHELVGRRSLFTRQASVISVTEIFLPSCPVYSAES